VAEIRESRWFKKIKEEGVSKYLRKGWEGGKG